MRRLTMCAALCALSGMLAACNDGLLHEAAPPGPGTVSLSASMMQGGTDEAYAQANTLFMRFIGSDEQTRLEQAVPFDAGAEEVRVAIQVPLREPSETLFLQVELRRDADPVFEGGAEVVLSAGGRSEIDVPLQPVVAGVACSGANVTLDAYGATVQLSAAALFVTGDTVPGGAIGWSTPAQSPATVNATGLVTAQSDGTATVTCSAGGATDTRTVIVHAAVVSVSVAPTQTAAIVGGTVPFTATARDRLQNVIPGRTVQWSSTPAAVATVNQSGVATGVTAGTARIDATIDGVTGSATLTVSFPPPAVTTQAPLGVIGDEATFSGTANPRGTATTAWFEYGTSPTLATFSSTQAQTIGAGSANVTVRQLVGLQPGTTWYVRIAASSAGGTARGQIVSFTTPSPGLPSVRTVSAAYIPNSDAFLQMDGAVNPNGMDTSFWFEYAFDGPNMVDVFATPLQRTPADWVELPFGDGDFMNGQQVWVRAVAENQFGRVYGNIVVADPAFGDAGPPAGGSTIIRRR